MMNRRYLPVGFVLLIAVLIAVSAFSQSAMRRDNHAPIANAGPDQTVPTGSIVTLTAGRSTDVDGDPLTFAWRFVSRPEGSFATLDNPKDVSPSFKVDMPGNYVISLIVNDGYVDSAADTVTISRTNSRPVANAGRDQTIAAGTTVRLDAGASSDADGDRLQFNWSFVSRPEGSAAVLANASSVSPTFATDAAGRYTVRLLVFDGAAISLPDTVVISTNNSAPVADAGPDQTIATGALVSLNGSASTDADGDSIQYSWSFVSRPASSAARLSDSSAVLPTFVADRPGSYVLQLIVNDGVNASMPDTIVVATRNSSPVARAGSAQSAAVGALVLLDGSTSSDADGDTLSYSWALTSQPAGSTATLNGTLTPRPTLVLDRAGSYVVQLIVSDGTTKSAPATVMISTRNSAPIAHAGSDRLGLATGADVMLEGDLSTDPDGDPLRYSWSFISRPAASRAALNATDIARPSFTLDEAGDYVLQLVVNDGNASSAPDTVLLRANLTTNSVTLTASDASASEAGQDPGTFTFSRGGSDAKLNTALVLSYTIGGTATNGTDYTPALSGSVTIPAGQTSASITITPVDDDIIEGSETVVLTLKREDAAAVSATVTIDDNDFPTVTVAASDSSASEAGADVGTFTFTRTGAVGTPLAVSYSTGGTATGGTDYTPVLTGTATIPAGQASVDVTITPLTDNLVENPETVVLTVQSGAGYVVGGPDSAIVTIADDPPIVSVTTVDTDAAEAGADTGTLAFTRSGGNLTSALTVNYTVGGTATNGTDYALIASSITIAANETSANRVIVPIADNIVESGETVVLTVSSSNQYNIGAPGAGTVTIADDPVIVTVAATDANASENGPDPGTFTFVRSGGDVTVALQVSFSRSGTATEDLDYVNLGSSIVTIPANQVTATRTVTPIVDNLVEGDETVIATINADPSYTIGASPSATVTIHDLSNVPLVSVVATDSSASEVGPNVGVFRFTRTGSTASSLTVNYAVGGTATNGTDYAAIGTSIVIGSGQTSADLTITPIVDGLTEPTETVTLTVVDAADYDVGSPASATVNIADAGSSCGPEGGPLGNGTTHCGAISNPGEVDAWTFTANIGDRIGVHIGEVTDNSDFTPWIRIIAPNSTTLGSAYGVGAAALDVAATQTGTYQVLVASYDSGLDGTGTYILTAAHTPGPITISAGDEGGPLTNGAMHSGQIDRGDLDVWTFTATAGDRIGVHIGEITDSNDFRPWIRIWAPNGAIIGSAYGVDAAALDVAATVTGNYLVLVASYDSGFDGSGTYRLTMTHTPGPITVSPGDQGGPLTNGGMHFGEILRGDLDVWTFSANQNDRIGVHVGEIIDNDDFRPWIRIWAPNGAIVGSAYGTDAAALDVAAPVTGDYLVLVASYDSAFDGSGTYRLTMTHTPGPITVSNNDEGGPLTNGAIHTGEIVQGDLDVWTFTATAGDRIAVHVGEITDTDDFRPWIRIWAPNGAIIGSAYGTEAAALDVAATVTGNYLVLVATYDSGFDGTGTYRLTMTHTPGPITVSPNDEGGPLTNGGVHTGEILQGDVDVWTFTATAGDRIAVHVGQITDTDDFRPWIRIWAPNGAILGSAYGTDAAALDVAANVTGNYLVLVASYDSGFDGEGTYRLTMTHTPGPIVVSPGDQGGPLTNGAMHTGEILKGDLDVWTFTANAGERIGLHVGEIVDNDDFRPWIRIWAPNGAVVGSAYGTDAAALEVVAGATGNYLVLVASYNSGFDGSGTYRLTVGHTGEAITVSPGDQGGPLSGTGTGDILQGDLDVWTFTATAGEHITIQINETAEIDDFRPWIRVWSPSGSTLGGAYGLTTATLNIVIPASGTYMIPVATYDSGFDGEGSYSIILTRN